MNAKKHPQVDLLDPSLHPTRRVEAMSSIAAELLLHAHDAELGERLVSSATCPRPLDTHSARWPGPPGSKRGRAQVALLVAAALLLVACSVAGTLILTR